MRTNNVRNPPIVLTLDVVERKLMDPWRKFSLYTEENLVYDHLLLFSTLLIEQLPDPITTSVVSLILLDRLLAKSKHVHLCTQNVFPIICSAFIVAHKLLADVSVTCLPCFPGILVKDMERLLLQSVDHQLFINSWEYDQYLYTLQ
eukprot:TRINITY_DN5141_c0_g1_i2.p1 TRINITY_DN5141_c0_g1~~TRINITY_DN5141_c0_g1_i2.p1  ORF type:complete len:146 (+),score=10.36 TRINITY_DN5141_c0_g1_i2:215-652(+)